MYFLKDETLKKQSKWPIVKYSQRLESPQVHDPQVRLQTDSAVESDVLRATLESEGSAST